MTRARTLIAVGLALLAATFAPPVYRAFSAPSQIIQQQVAVCDPWWPTECAAPGGSRYTNIAANASTVLKASGPATFASIVVNTAGVGSTATVYDNTTCTGTVIGTFSTAAQVSLPVDARAGTGLCVTTAGGTPANITVLWR